MRIGDSNPEARKKLEALRNSLTPPQWTPATGAPTRHTKAEPRRTDRSPTASKQKKTRRTQPKVKLTSESLDQMHLSDERRAFIRAIIDRSSERLQKGLRQRAEDAIVGSISMDQSLIISNLTFSRAVLARLYRSMREDEALIVNRCIEGAYKEVSAEFNAPTKISHDHIDPPPSMRPKVIPAQHALNVLQTVDASADFATALETLGAVFRSIRTEVNTPAVSVFLKAIDNRFALVVPEHSRSQLLTASTTVANHSTLAQLPTSSGLAIFKNHPDLIAWNLSTEDCLIARTSTDELRDFLAKKSPPTCDSVRVSAYRPSTNAVSRLLSSIADCLTTADIVIHPLFVGARGFTTRHWGDTPARGMKWKTPHRVREHLRRLPSGELATVQEHSRFGSIDWENGDVRVQILPSRTHH